MRALLALYQALRTAITDAVETASRAPTPTGPAPDRRRDRQELVTGARGVTRPPRRTWPATSAAPSWPACTGRARPRVCARRVKSPLTRWAKHPPGKPRANLKITSVTTVVSQYRDEKRDTPPTVFEPGARTLTPRHCG